MKSKVAQNKKRNNPEVRKTTNENVNVHNIRKDKIQK